MTSEAASRVKRAGHAAEAEFATLVKGQIYPGSRKRDVFDRLGNIHSVKSGDKKWQWFLYGRNRFAKAIGFPGGPLFLACIDAFPTSRKVYLANKAKYKKALQPAMRALKDFLASSANGHWVHPNKLIFLNEAIFHASEVDFLSIKEADVFHVFDSSEVLEVLDKATRVENSKAVSVDQTDDQKVIFKIANGTTLGEIEMRNDSEGHYREVKFWMDREKVLTLLKKEIKPRRMKSRRLLAYGKAASSFKL